MRFYYVPNCVLPCPYPYYFNPPAFAIFNLFISADYTSLNFLVTAGR